MRNGIDDRDGQGCGPGPGPAGRPVRLGPVRPRAAQRLGLLGRHPAAVHRLRGLRGVRLGIWASAAACKEAPAFFSIYTALIVLGAGIILLPIKSLVQAMLASQTLNGVLLPVILIVMLRLINDKRLMGRFANGRVFNIIAWVMVAILIVLTVILVLTTVFPNLLG